MEREFSRQIFENSPNIKLMKIRPVGAELFHADGQTDRHDEANIHFSQFCGAPKKMINRAPYFFVFWDIREYSKSIRDRRLGSGCFTLP
jgi:hypothetical protein